MFILRHRAVIVSLVIMHPLFDRLIQILGVGLILISLIDIYLIVLYPRSGKSWLSTAIISKGTWWLFQQIAKIGRFVRRSKRLGAAILSFCDDSLKPFYRALVISTIEVK